MVLKTYAWTLKTLRWLGPASIGLDDRSDLEWLLYACPNPERVEITDDNTFCGSGQGAVGTIIIPIHNPATSSLLVPPITAKTLPVLSKLGLTSWACTPTLKYRNTSFRPSPTINGDLQYRIQIESFYKKLGHLAALVELHIGCECPCRGPQLQTSLHTICPDDRATAVTLTTTHPPHYTIDTYIRRVTVYKLSPYARSPETGTPQHLTDPLAQHPNPRTRMDEDSLVQPSNDSPRHQERLGQRRASKELAKVGDVVV